VIDAFPARGGLRGAAARFAAVTVAVAFAVLLVAYVGLIESNTLRAESFRYFSRTMLPLLLGHAVLLLLLIWALKPRAGWLLLFWSGSALALALAGSASVTRGFPALALFACVLLATGKPIADRLLDAPSRGWAASLGFGIAATAVLASFLAACHWLRPVILIPALLGIGFALWGSTAFRFWKAGSARLSYMRPAIARLRDRWNAPVNWTAGLAVEGLFLVAVFILVSAAAPEGKSDAMRFYWPYVKLLAHHAGFFDNPYQSPYILPQAGLAYAAAVLTFSAGAVRWAMPLVWLALVGIACRRLRLDREASSAGVVMVTAACPVVVWVASSLMQDLFVSLSVVLLALLCIEGREPGSRRYWAALGIACGLAWTAKYTTAAYAMPLAMWGIWRAARGTPPRQSIQGAALACICGVGTALPWLWHAYRQSGNPVFPFFPGLFPSPLWPKGLGSGNLDLFYIPFTVRGWLFWPIDMTLHAERFVETNPGGLGLVVPVIVVAGLVGFWKSRPPMRALFMSAAAGTLLLWSQTAYFRYWMPGVWLAALAAGDALQDRVRARTVQGLVVAAALVISLCQLPAEMTNSWSDPKGWPWDFYTGKIGEADYLDRVDIGFKALRSAEFFRRSLTIAVPKGAWPRVWSTGFQSVGHLDVEPMEATLWEMSAHGLDDVRSQADFLASAGSEFWIVNHAAEDARWIKASGLGGFFWQDSARVALHGRVAVYRMPPAQKVLQAFDSRVSAGSELILDPGMEMGDLTLSGYWWADTPRRWLQSESNALSGRGVLQFQPGAAAHQDVALPRGLEKVSGTASARSQKPGAPGAFLFQVVWTDLMGTFIHADSLRIETQDVWTKYELASRRPPNAQFVSVYFSDAGNGGAALVDEVHLYSESNPYSESIPAPGH